MRLVLLAMVQRMDAAGRGCWIGARRLASMCALDKSTVAEHRARAIELGWLLPPDGGKHATRSEWLPAVPAGVAIRWSKGRGPGKPALSGLAGQCEASSLSGLSGSLSGLSGASVRRGRTNHPRSPYQSSDAHARERAEGLARLRQKPSPPAPPSPDELRRKVIQLRTALPDLGSTDIARQLQADPSTVAEILQEAKAS